MADSIVRSCPGCGLDLPERCKVACSHACRQRVYRSAGRRYYEGLCKVCGKTWRTNRQNATLCSDECRGIAYTGVRKPPRPPRATPQRLPFESQPGPLRQAMLDGDGPLVVSIMLQSTTPEGDCRLWSRSARKGYGVTKVDKRWCLAHRIVAEAIYGELSFMPVHHKCGRPLCINPDHLQVVTPHENTAEMLERNHYLRRIADLEAALSEVLPGHPLLA